MKLKSLSIVLTSFAAAVMLGHFDSTAAIGQQLSIASNYKPVVGEPHPDFVLPAIDDGRKIWLSQYRGKKVVLIHFASW